MYTIKSNYYLDLDIMVMQNTAKMQGNSKLEFDLKGSVHNRNSNFDMKEVLKTKSWKKCLKDLDYGRIREQMKLINLPLD